MLAAVGLARARGEHAARTVGRRTAARRHRARAGAPPDAAARGRAHRQPRSGQRGAGAGAVARAGQEQACGLHPGHAFAGGGGDGRPHRGAYRAGPAGGAADARSRRATGLSRAALFLAPLAQHKGRLAVSVLAIALGVALGYAVQLINAVALNEFSQAVRSLAGDGRPGNPRPARGLRRNALSAHRAHGAGRGGEPGAGSRCETARAGGQALRVLGVDAFRAAAVQPALIGEVARRHARAAAPDAVFLSPGAADWLELKPGDRLALQVGLAEVSLRVAGLLRGARARAPRRDGHRRGAAARSAASGRSAASTSALRPGADVGRSAAQLQALAAGPDRRAAAKRPAAQRQPVARLPGESERARAGGAVHRRLPRVLGAGAVGGAPARAARAAARARRDPRRDRTHAADRGRADRRGRRRDRPRRRLRSSRRRCWRDSAPTSAPESFADCIPTCMRIPGRARCSLRSACWSRWRAASPPRWRRRVRRREQRRT